MSETAAFIEELEVYWDNPEAIEAMMDDMAAEYDTQPTPPAAPVGGVSHGDTMPSTQGLTQKIRRAIHNAFAPDYVKPNRVRAIDADMAPEIAKAVRQALKQTDADDVLVVVHVHGGFVPSSYKWRADADHLEVELHPQTGDVAISAWRGRCAKRRHGVGEQIVSHIRKADQTQGRLVR
jgi:hypothetical protein